MRTFAEASGESGFTPNKYYNLAARVYSSNTGGIRIDCLNFGTIGKSPSNSEGNNLRIGRSEKFRISKPKAAILFLSVMAIILVACGGSSSSSGSSGGGDRAPNFAVTLFQGADVLGATEINIHDLPLGKPLVLNFWAGLCPPCRAEMPDLQKFSDEFGDRITLLGVDLGQFTGLGSNQDAKDLLKELGVTYPTGFTNDANVIKNYRVFGLPATVFIGSDGNIFKNWGGALNLEVLQEQANAMLSQ
ncbi:MAG: TlpA family protein disulfide reductase [Candidatus Marinimicrobia bacterium]|nr:TlpA family protein disulfide reductase [Candidatus Neomarinimicrobiota bacterium]